MAHLIDKDVLVAEIEKRIKSTNNDIKIGAIESLTISKTLNSLISFLDTLEVKEVDEQKESLTWEDIPTILTISEQLKTGWWFVDRTKDIGTQAFWEEVLKRFKAQKGEEV